MASFNQHYSTYTLQTYNHQEHQFIWSPLASWTNINKLQVMQSAALRTATGCTQDTHIQHLHDETLILHIHEHLQLHNKRSHRLPHNHYNRHKNKTNMRYIHTSIVSRHLATRGNNKILRTPPPHISSSEEILPRLNRRTRAQFRTNKSPFLKSYQHKVDAKSHPSPLCPLCNTHTHDT